MKKNIKNIELNRIKEGNNRVDKIVTNSLQKNALLPNTVVYKDIDDAFKKWSDNELSIIYENKVLKTITLLSNQRFSEYSQTWSETDEDKNVLMNFKTVLRENNPKQGTNLNGGMNIPGDRFYEVSRQEVIAENNVTAYDVFSMKQPFNVDIKYQLSIFTNKYELINIFNNQIQNQFKSFQSYICPNGYYMSLNLETIADESEYNIDNRKYFSQTAYIVCKAYIIDENSVKIERIPSSYTTVISIGENIIKPIPSIEENDDTNDIVIDIDFNISSIDYISFTIPYTIQFLTDNVKNINYYKIYIENKNGEIINTQFPFIINENTKIFVKAKRNSINSSLIKIFGKKM